jgi:PAS domain S-box-containing protein
LDQDDGPTIMAVVYDPDGRVIGATKTTEVSTGYAEGSLVGQSYADLIDDVDLTTERANFARLANGEVDYLDFHANRRRADGDMVEIAMHRVAVRHLDSKLACVVSVGRFVRVSARVRDLLGDRPTAAPADEISD